MDLATTIKELVQQYEEGLITEVEMASKVTNECLIMLEGSN